MLVLLFYNGYDLKAIDAPFGQILSRSHHFIRTVKRLICRQQVFTGYYTGFRALVRGLRDQGHDVRINDFKTARQNPGYPIGLCGFAKVLEVAQDLPNPVLYGPGEISVAPDIIKIYQQDRFKKFLLRSGWERSFHENRLPQNKDIFFTGIDTDEWPNLSKEEKTHDFLIYDKMYFEIPENRQKILSGITSYLDQKSKSYTLLTYGNFTRRAYKKALQESRSMIWLCAHETQGMAYQEALAGNLPILAWDEGTLKDPALIPHAPENLEVSSVPYFDEQCGARFTLDDFEEKCDIFLKRLNGYKPRNFIKERLSPEESLKIYLKNYSDLI